MLLRDSAALAIFLKRSKQLSLSLVVENGYPYGPTLEKTEYGIMFREVLFASFAKFIRRCHRLELNVRFNSFPWDGTASTISSAIHEATRLKTLSIFRGWARFLKLEAIQYTRLQSLTTFETERPLQLFGDLPADTLRHLEIKGDFMDWVEFVKTAKSFSNLRSLKLSMVCPTYSTDMESLSKKLSATHMEHLDHLSVKFSHAFHVENSPLRMLEYIDAPNLVSFHACLSLNQSHTGAAELATFLSRTPLLIHLSLEDGVSFGVDEHCMVLQSVPQLKSLSFAHCALEGNHNGTIPLIAVLTETSECISSRDAIKHAHPLLCPSLEDITIKAPPIIRSKDVLALLTARVCCADEGIKSSEVATLDVPISEGQRTGSCLGETKLRRARISAHLSHELPEWDHLRGKGLLLEIS